MKKLAVVLAIISMFFALSVSLAASGIQVQLDGQYLDFKDANGNVVEPQIINDRTMVPLRKIFEALDCNITWDDATKTVIAVSASKEIKLTINNPIATVKDLSTQSTSNITLDSVPVIVDSRTLVPVRFIAESLEKNVDWDAANRTVIIIDYDKLTQLFKQKVPALQDLFDFKISELKSFKSSATVDGKITYAEAGAKDEVINMNGSSLINVNGQDLEATVKVDFKGPDGAIMSALKEQGFEHLNCKFVIKSGKAYLGTTTDGVNYTWEDLSTDVASSIGMDLDFSMAGNVDGSSLNSYEDVINILKNNNTSVDSNTYATLVKAFEAIGQLISKDSVKLTTNGSDATLSITLDFGKLLTSFLGDDAALVADSFNLVIKTDITKSNGVLASDTTKLDVGFALPETGEKVKLQADCKTTYTNVNQAITINAPAM